MTSWINNRTLVASAYLIRFIVFVVLTAGMTWALIARILTGTEYMAFVIALITIVKEVRLPVLDEHPAVIPVGPPPAGKPPA